MAIDAEEKADAGSSSQQNRRKSPRFEVDEDAWLLLVNHGSRMPCRIVDLSPSGCRLRTWDRFRAGSLVRVEINFKIRGMAFRFGGVTQWTDGRHTVGVRFVDVIARRRDELAEALSEIEEAIAARTQEPVTPEQATNKLAVGEPAFAVKADFEQINETLASWKEEKQASTRASVLEFPAQPLPTPPILPSSPLNPAAETVFLSPESEPKSPQAEPEQPIEPEVKFSSSNSVSASFPAGSTLPICGEERTPTRQAGQLVGGSVKRDRREQPRHRVDTSAVIFLVNIASRLQGRILDLSMGGCRIRTGERFPVGIYTRVETEFHLEGLPFLLAGVTQTIYDRHLVGIRFLEMSHRKREQLEQLIAEIREQQTADE